MIAPIRISAALTSQDVVYAYLSADTVLYSATADGYTPMFTMPATYFVMLLSDDKDGYTAAKSEFVRRVTALARGRFAGRYALWRWSTGRAGI